MLPDMTGIDILREIKRDSPLTEVIIITAHASIQTAVEAMALGARDYLEKPVDLKLLASRIENIRDLQSRSDEAETLSHAKKVIEEEAGRTIALLETKLQESREKIERIRELIQNDAQKDSGEIMKGINEVLNERATGE